MARVTFWIFVGAALSLGAFMAVQPAINGQLRWKVGSPAHAAMISTFVSTIALLLFVFMFERKPWPNVEMVRETPWWMWTGGLLGAAYVALSIVLVQRLGGAVAFSLIILGQMVFALVIDHFGLLGVPQHELTPQRLFAVALVVSGAAMLRLF